ncbi:MAG: hypothetical protein D6701_08700, partial [Gemmatimonadetes bacterium]
MSEARPSYGLLEALRAQGSRRPAGRRFVVARYFGEGAEVLRALALHGGGWSGFEVTTPARLAAHVAARELAHEGLSVLDDFAVKALADEVLDRVLEGPAWQAFRPLGEGVGFREAVAGTLQALR